MAGWAQAYETLGAIRREQPRLPPLVRDDFRAMRATSLTGRVIASQGFETRLISADHMIAIERNMEEHPEEEKSDTTPPATERRQQCQCPRHVEQPHARALFWLRSTKVAHSGDRIEAALVDAEPRQMIYIDQDGRGPWEQDPASQDRDEHARSHGGQCDMITNAHLRLSQHLHQRSTFSASPHAMRGAGR